MREKTEIDLYCRRCRKSLHIMYKLSGNLESPVLPNITIKCAQCTRVMSAKNYTEHQILEHTKNSKYYI